MFYPIKILELRHYKQYTRRFKIWDWNKYN